MANDDSDRMQEAIRWAEGCKPIREGIPKVGAIIATPERVIGRGRRGTGEVGDDHHAEFNALRNVVDHDRPLLAQATVYTTLEPCTPEVRSDPLTCCTELIRQAHVRKVFIGILDPNQGVRGKGLWELQERGIEVELFPPELAGQVRVLNDAFIRAQRRLGIRIIEPTRGETIRTYDKGGAWVVRGSSLNTPGSDVYAFVVGPSGHWAPQPHSLKQLGDGNDWEVKVFFSTYGPHTIYIIKANELGVALVNYYRKVVRTNQERKNQLRGQLKVDGPDEDRFLRTLRGDYQGIEMSRLPKGLEIQDSVEVIVESPPS